MAGNAPRGEVGARKIAAAKSAQQKKLAFLAGLLVTCSPESRELITGSDGQVLTGRAIDIALGQAKDAAEDPSFKVSFTFTDKKGKEISLVEISNARRFVADCQKTINKWSPKVPTKKTVKVAKSKSENS